MKKVLVQNFEAGSENANEPRLIGNILAEMLHSDSPLAEGYRHYLTSKKEGGQA